MNYVYMVQCSDGTLYTGWTTDVEKRVKAHNEGKGAKYTKSRLPVELFYREECESKSQALKREARIKKTAPKRKTENEKQTVILKTPVENQNDCLFY